MNLKHKNKNFHHQNSTLNIHEDKSAYLKFFSSQKFIAFLALIFLVLLSFPLAKSYSRRLVADKEIEAMRDKIAEYEKTNQELQELLNFTYSEESIEDYARSSLNLKKPDEGVVIIQKNEEVNNLEKEENLSTSSSNLSLWFSYFFK